MSKNIIIYSSSHHGNTRKLVEAISGQYNVEVIDADMIQCHDLTVYDHIGFASGIDFGRFYHSVENFLQVNLPRNKKVFFLYTCAKVNPRFTGSMREEAQKKESKILGEYGCKGYNTYGPWKLVGGMNKGHPNELDIRGALVFYESILNK